MDESRCRQQGDRRNLRVRLLELRPVHPGGAVPDQGGPGRQLHGDLLRARARHGAHAGAEDSLYYLSTTSIYKYTM